MRRRITAKWRPPLALVLGGTLAAVFCLPLLGIGYFRLAGGVLGWAETTWLIGWIAFLCASLLGYLLWRLVLRPIRALTDYAKGADAPVPDHFGTPEFSDLGQSVLDMTAKLQAREAVLRSYADHVTHELKSPLTSVRGAAELLEEAGLTDADHRKLLGNIRDATARMEALLDGQRALARAQEPMPAGECRLSDLLANIEHTAMPRDGVIPLPRAAMKMSAEHLVSNALAHGAKLVTFDLTPNCLKVSDDGVGISDGNRDRIFDPFFTTRRSSGGTGMGLPIVQRMLAAQGAEITLSGESGAVFEIRW